MNLSKKIIFSSLLSISFILIPEILFAKQLEIPFTPQAPQGIWSQPWQDDCEEAVITMAKFYYLNKTINTKIAIKQINQIRNIKEGYYGFSLDEEADKITELINNFLPFEARVVSNPSIDQIKNEINNNRPVILPAYGKYLSNPFFGSAGVQYHVILISGYDDNSQEFITQEPGTRHGKNYKYSYKTIMNAMHDYKKNNTKNGRRVAIFTQKNLTSSASIDADHDGLNKQQEFEHHTISWLSDSDGDGYSDGQEVTAGHSPIRKVYKPKHNDLIKSNNNNKVYIIKNNQKHHITSEQVFIKNNYKWQDIKIIMPAEINMIIEGAEILE